MTRKLLAVAAALLIAGCGGGGEASVPIFAMPSFDGEEIIVVSAQRSSITVSDGEFLIRFAGTGDVTISGNGNKVAFAASESGGMVAVTGDGNTLVFRPGATVKSLTVSGRNNTIYVAEGSGVTVSSPEGSGTTVRTYRL